MPERDVQAVPSLDVVHLHIVESKECAKHLLDTARNAWVAALNNRLRPRLVRLRLRGFSGMLGIKPALKMRFRLCAESKPPSRLR